MSVFRNSILGIDLKSYIRDIPDFPKKGILFRDITPLLASPHAFAESIKRLSTPWKTSRIDKVVAMEARGFIFGSAVALELGCGFVPVRKQGKLPYKTKEINYELEYGNDVLCIHEDAITSGERILLVDDLLATGGTSEAVVRLVENLGGVLVGVGVLIELKSLEGAKRLVGYPMVSELVYP
jgi:adenine phosphoribosyltransferase